MFDAPGPIATRKAGSSPVREGKRVPTGVSTRIVRETLDAADKEFRWCHGVVAAMTASKVDASTGESVVKFQLRLLGALETVEKVYRSIKSEEKRLISHKHGYNPAWFKRRMAQLASRAQILNHALTIGRSIGDGFAWFFYERDRDLITQHLSHQRQPLLPSKIGGLGERLTLERLQGLDGNLLIYHGTTTFLRMGDISFVDLKTVRVTCIGELKTQRIDENFVSVSMSLMAGEPGKFPRIPNSRKKALKTPPLSSQVRARRARQVKVIGAALAQAREPKVDQAIGINSEFYFDALSEVVRRSHRRSFEFIQAGPSLVIGALRLSRGGTLASNFMGRFGGIEHAIADAPQWALKVLNPEIECNSLILGSLGSPEDIVVTNEALPLLWWPTDSEALRQILFGEVVVITMFNPAQLWRGLKCKGFDLVYDERKRLRSAVRARGETKFELENLDYFHRLIRFSLMKQESIITMVDQMVTAATERAGRAPGRIEFRPRISRRPSVERTETVT